MVFLKEYKSFVKIKDGEIYAYDMGDFGEADSLSEGILRSVDVELAHTICLALSIDSVGDYNIVVHNDEYQMFQEKN